MTVRLLIDELPINVEKGATILEAARQHELYIPTLCDYPGLPAHGSCRMCIVDIQGKQNTPTACTTLAEEGMVIQTNSPKVQALRAELLQMLLAEHPSSCLFCPEKSHCDECMVTLRKAGVTTGCRSCPKDHECDLQRIVEKLGLSQVNYPGRYRMLKPEKSDPFFDRDINLCVLCGRCIRICNENHFATSIAYTNRGSETVISAAFGRTLLDAGCSFCGACIEVCPTGALSEKTRKWDGKPEKETSTTCPFCSIGCQIRLLSKNNTVIGSLPDHQAGTDVLCVKGRFGITELVNHPTRLKKPQKAVGDDHLFITWDETIRLAAERCSACPPDQFKMTISSDCSNEDLFVARKFTRNVMKSDHFCSSISTIPPDESDPRFRLLKRSQPLNILTNASTILCLGLDGHFSQSVVEVKLHLAKINGAKMIAVDSQEHRLSQFADQWLRPISGKETELIRSLLKLIRDPSLALLNEMTGNRIAPITQAARLLREATDLVILIAPSLLRAQPSQEFCTAVEQLANECNARVVVIPDRNNRIGNVFFGASEQPDCTTQTPEVLYLIGENIPASPPGRPFILYQNIVLPASSIKADLILPTTAFCEADGTCISYSGQMQQIHQAVLPPGEALPTWQILSRIAKTMGIQGFDYHSIADIQSEMTGLITGFAGDQQTGEHNYMGFPLTRWVEGLRWLVPPEIVKTRNAYVHHP